MDHSPTSVGHMFKYFDKIIVWYFLNRSLIFVKMRILENYVRMNVVKITC